MDIKWHPYPFTYEAASTQLYPEIQGQHHMASQLLTQVAQRQDVVQHSWLDDQARTGSHPSLNDSPSPSGVSSSDEHNLSGRALNDSSSDPLNVECIVCGDKSSGKHYGQFTCEGCKSFFKRSVRRNLSYTCRATKSCPIDIHHRNQCQYCRLKKCLRQGMRKEAVQRGRVPPSAMSQFATNLIVPPARPTSTTPSNNNNNVKQPPRSPSIKSTASNQSVHTVVAQLIRAEPFPLQQFATDLHRSCNNLLGVDALCELSARLLFTAVEWSRHIPFYQNELPPADQVELLRQAWSALFILNAAQCQMPIHAAPLLAASGMHQALPQEQQSSRILDNVRTFQSVIEKLKNLQLDAAEFACMKGVVLFCSDSLVLKESQLIEKQQERCVQALEAYCCHQKAAKANRFAKLMLRLSSLRALSADDVQELFFSRLVGKTPIDTLIRDMINNQPTISTSAVIRPVLDAPTVQCNESSSGVSTGAPSSSGTEPMMLIKEA